MDITETGPLAHPHKEVEAFTLIISYCCQRVAQLRKIQFSLMRVVARLGAYNSIQSFKFKREPGGGDYTYHAPMLALINLSHFFDNCPKCMLILSGHWSIYTENQSQVHPPLIVKGWSMRWSKINSLEYRVS